MNINEFYSNGRIHKKIYSNGKLAIYIKEVDGQPFAELSVSKDFVYLDHDGFILKEKSENA